MTVFALLGAKAPTSAAWLASAIVAAYLSTERVTASAPASHAGCF